MKFAYLIEPPFNYRNADGAVTGCDFELAKAILRRVGIDDFDPVETEFAQLLPGLVDKRWRMTTGLFATEERQNIAIFSRPVWALADGLLVRSGNPKGLTGYRSVAHVPDCKLAVIRDQFQHRCASAFDVPDDRILTFETYAEAAQAVRLGRADAYASVARAHASFVAQNADAGLKVVEIDAEEKAPAFGCFAFNKSDALLRDSIDGVLIDFLGSDEHRVIMRKFGFTDSEIDLVAA